MHAWRRRAGVDADVVLDEAEAVHRGGAIGPGVAGVVVPARRGGGERSLYPAEAVGVAAARGDCGLASVDQAVVGLGVRVGVHPAPPAAYRLSEDVLAVPEDASARAAYASAVALGLAAATGHPSREGRRDAGAARGSLGWAREQLRCDLAAAKIVGALGLAYEPPRGSPLPAEAREVFVRHGADLCRGRGPHVVAGDRPRPRDRAGPRLSLGLARGRRGPRATGGPGAAGRSGTVALVVFGSGALRPEPRERRPWSVPPGRGTSVVTQAGFVRKEIAHAWQYPAIP